MLRTVGHAALLLLLAGPAWAHPGDGASGFWHPLTGPDHLLAMIGAGAWAAFLAVRRPAAALLVPLAFITMMAAGAAAGFAGIKLPFAEAGVLASVFMLGGLVMAAVSVPVDTAMLLVGMFAILHGYAHAQDAPQADPGSYILGFLASTALLQVVGLTMGWLAQRTVGVVALRVMGGAVIAGGALVLVNS